ncbi:phage tail fiber protein, partial [Campylobacter jejuni]
IEGYATDEAFAFEAVQLAQAVMGVDGRMSAGYTPQPVVQTISIQADSPSKFIFEAWIAAMKTAREVFYSNGTLAIPSLERKYTLQRGVL